MLAAAGVWMEAYSPSAMAVQGDSLKLEVLFNNQEGAAMRLDRVLVAGFDTAINADAPKNKNISFSQILFRFSRSTGVATILVA